MSPQLKLNFVVKMRHLSKILRLYLQLHVTHQNQFNLKAPQILQSPPICSNTIEFRLKNKHVADLQHALVLQLKLDITLCNNCFFC